MRFPYHLLYTSLASIAPELQRASPVPVSSLSNILCCENIFSTFSAYVKEAEIGLFSTPGANVTVFAPTNEAIAALKRKPHEGPYNGDEIELTKEQMLLRRKKFARDWILGHVVPTYPLTLQTGEYPTLYEGSTLKFEVQDGEGPEWARGKLASGGTLIAERQATNGVLYIANGVVFEWPSIEV